ncbi:organic Anion Transporter Polypeptide family protein [Teladorsagia circumcincta]|uniref:Organic Anion Transporter Polypeptide family protein n=1 Tax=Teladorsagia circumcincta TaxID=45464 RepID=A0A2G9V529_TELCI|nr:organic Anion Transporter Polypeptide family protein [Teladorsagia circumcincta]
MVVVISVNKVRCIGYGMFLVGIGALILILPHFLDGRSYPVLLLSQLFIGFGAAPLFTYGYSTIDEFDSHKKTGNNMDTDERKKNDVVQTHVKLNVDFSGDKFAYFKIFKMFFFSKTCMALIAMQTAESMIMNGYITFIPKLFENLFGFSSSWASTMTGLIIVPMGLIGSFVGGKLGERVENRFRVELDTYSLTHSCNRACQCDGLFNPVCAVETSVSYFSPCHAGCTTVGAFTSPVLMANGSKFHMEDEVYQSSIPGAVLFGAVIDTTCMHWSSSCDGSMKCVLYNAENLGHYIFMFTIVTKVICFLCLFIALKTYIPVEHDATECMDNNGGGSLPLSQTRTVYVVDAAKSTGS